MGCCLLPSFLENISQVQSHVALRIPQTDTTCACWGLAGFNFPRRSFRRLNQLLLCSSKTWYSTTSQLRHLNVCFEYVVFLIFCWKCFVAFSSPSDRKVISSSMVSMMAVAHCCSATRLTAWVESLRSLLCYFQTKWVFEPPSYFACS